MTDARVEPSRLPFATAVAAAGGVLGNVAIHAAATRYGRVTVSLTETIAASVVGAIAAALVLAALARVTPFAVRWFTVLATIAIGVLGVAPVAAAYAPLRADAPLFTLTTVVATELMHINSGAWALTALLRLATKR